jgi:hypothetical protein
MWFCKWRRHYVQQWKIPAAPSHIICQDTCSAWTPAGPMNIQILFPCNIVKGQRIDWQEEQQSVDVGGVRAANYTESLFDKSKT